MMRCVALILASVTLACAGVEEDRTRIVLITLDTLRFDTFNGTPERKSAMPRTRAFAERGQLFVNFYASSSLTQPTHASLFTGLHPWEHGVPRNGLVLDPDLVTVAERLRKAGFATAAVVASHTLRGATGFGQGFDRFRDDFTSSHPSQLEEPSDATRGRHFFSLSDAVTERALAQLDAAEAPRQFFWFHYFDPHEPYGDTVDRPFTLRDVRNLARQRSPQMDEVLARARRLYRRDATTLDERLGRLLERLDADADRFATHVLLTSDHGESFGEGAALGHGNRLTREQLHVPLAIVSPQLAPAIRRDTASSVDLPATLYALAGLEVDGARGRDLTAPAGSGRVDRVVGMRQVFSAPQRDVTPTGEVLVHSEQRFFAVDGTTIYAGDAESVAEEDLLDRLLPADRAAPYRALFATFAEKLARVESRELVDEETRAGLRALGYVESPAGAAP